MPDAVNILILNICLRLLETRRYIAISKKVPDIPSSWRPACSACFMSDAGNIPLLEGLPKHFESKKKYVQVFHGPLSSAAQERQPRDPLLEDHPASEHHHAFQSHVLEPDYYFLGCDQTCLELGFQLLQLEGSMEVCKSQIIRHVLGMRFALYKLVLELRGNCMSAHILTHDNPRNTKVLRPDKATLPCYLGICVVREAESHKGWEAKGWEADTDSDGTERGRPHCDKDYRHLSEQGIGRS